MAESGMAPDSIPSGSSIPSQRILLGFQTSEEESKRSNQKEERENIEKILEMMEDDIHRRRTATGRMKQRKEK